MHAVLATLIDGSANSTHVLFHTKIWDQVSVVWSLFSTQTWSDFKVAHPEYSLPTFVHDPKSYLIYLASDPAHGGDFYRMSKDRQIKGIAEALTIISAVCMGYIGGPVLRQKIARLDFIAFGPATSRNEIRPTPMSCLLRGDGITALHKDLIPIDVDVKQPIFGKNHENGVEEELQRDDSGGVVVLLDACWFDENDIKVLEERVCKEFGENRLVVLYGNPIFEHVFMRHDGVVQ